MREQKRDIVLLMRSNRKMAALERELGEDASQVQVIWSMWDGYWERDEHVRPFCEKHGIARIRLHTSGHAALNDLQRFAEALKPGVVVPIHTEHARLFSQHFESVRLLSDGEVLDL